MGVDVSVGLHGLGADGGLGCGVSLSLHGFVGERGDLGLRIGREELLQGGGDFCIMDG